MHVETRKTLVEVAREARWLMREYPEREFSRRTAVTIASHQVYSMVYPRRYWR